MDSIITEVAVKKRAAQQPHHLRGDIVDKQDKKDAGAAFCSLKCDTFTKHKYTPNQLLSVTIRLSLTFYVR